jgi:ubiquinone biosynthesis protein Coq4
MRKIVNLLRIGSTYLRLVRDTGRLDLVFALADSLTDNPSPGLQKMLALPEVRAYLASDIKPLRVELQALRAMPEGSLGRAFAAFLDQRGLDPNGLYHSGDAGTSDAARFKLHMERTHDLWHTVLGFDTDVAGELGLQAFSIAQIHSGLGYVILSGGLLNSLLFVPEDGPRRMEAIARGWNLGKTTRPLFGADWEKMLTWPIEQVRAHFGIRDADVQSAAMAA